MTYLQVECSYRGPSYSNAMYKIPMNNDDDRAQQAILTVLFHYGRAAQVGTCVCKHGIRRRWRV